jgi:hypothetical protein
MRLFQHIVNSLGVQKDTEKIKMKEKHKLYIVLKIDCKQ